MGDSRPAVTKAVTTIGYPAYDSRIREPDLMERIFGRIYDKKRLAPGAVTQLDETRIWHNCTTLGGNSGSVVLDLESGKAFGLHFSGSFLTTNYAVRADVVGQLLDDVRAGRRRPEARAARQPLPVDVRMAVSQRGADGAGTASVTIPLTVTVSLGAPVGRAPPLGLEDTSPADDVADCH